MSRSDIHNNELRVRGRMTLAIISLLLIAAFSISNSGDQAFTSSEVRFTDSSAGGLAIVPASCPSIPTNPDFPHDDCSPTPPSPTPPGPPTPPTPPGPPTPPTPSPTPGGGCSGEACGWGENGVADPPEITFEAERYLVESGDTTELYWDTEFVSSCILEDYGTVADVTDSSTTTEPILSQTTFVLTCVGSEDGTTIDEDLTIGIIPVFCETGVEGCNNPGGQSSISPSSQVAAVAGSAEGDLSATIRAAILSDPRSATMSEAEIDTIVSALAAEAAESNITSYDVLWRPQEEPQLVAQNGVATCNFLCMLTQAFGFDGSDMAIPIGLGVTAALLLFVIGAILHHRYGRHPIAGDLKVNAE